MFDVKSTPHVISVVQHSEQEVEVILDKCIMLFRFLQDKVVHVLIHIEVCVCTINSPLIENFPYFMKGQIHPPNTAITQNCACEGCTHVHYSPWNE